MTWENLKIPVSCNVQIFPCSGTFKPTKLDLVFGKLVLKYDFSKSNQPSFVVNENVSDLSVQVDTPSSGISKNIHFSGMNLQMHDSSVLQYDGKDRYYAKTAL